MQNKSVYISLGGNLGNIEENFYQALYCLHEDTQTSVIRISSLYQTPPWGGLDQPDFLNLVAEVNTTHTPHSFLTVCLDIEKKMHRERSVQWGPRTLDIDILLFGDLCLNEKKLTIPHPYMCERGFVLLPLFSIAPNLLIGGKNIEEFLAVVETKGIQKIAFKTDRLNMFFYDR